MRIFAIALLDESDVLIYDFDLRFYFISGQSRQLKNDYTFPNELYIYIYDAVENARVWYGEQKTNCLKRQWPVILVSLLTVSDIKSHFKTKWSC